MIAAFIAATAAQVTSADLPSGPSYEFFVPSRTTESPDVINGRLVDPAGLPIADAFLIAIAVGESPAKRIGIGVRTNDRVMATRDPEKLRDLPIEGTHTSSDGSFRLPCTDGRAQHVYLMVSPHDDAFDRPSERLRLTTAPLSVGTSGVVLRTSRELLAQQRTTLFDPVTEPGHGWIDLTVRDAKGRLVEGGFNFNLRRGGRSFFDHHVAYLPWFSLDVPPGDLEVVVDVGPARIFWCANGRHEFLAPLGPGMSCVHVEPGERHAVEVRLIAGSHLRLALHAPGVTMPPRYGYEVAAGRPEAARVILIDGRGAEMALSFHAPTVSPGRSFPGIVPGTRCLTSTVISPGVYEMKLTAPGYRSVHRWVEITDEPVTELELLLQADRPK